MQVYFLNVWQRSYSTGPGAVKACHLWCFTRQQRAWAPEPGELQLATDALTVSEHAQDTYAFQYQVIYFFFQNGSLWQQFDWCCLLFIQQGFMYYLIQDILLISGALLVFFIPSVNCFFFNSNILLRTICLT